MKHIKKRISSHTHKHNHAINQTAKNPTSRIQIDFNAERHKKTFEAQFVMNALPNKHMHTNLQRESRALTHFARQRKERKKI